MFFKYLEYPSEEEWKIILENSPVFNGLHFEIEFKKERINEFQNFMQGFVLESWVRHFNNKLIEVCHTYIFVTHHFNKGIPDDPWFISPGKSGSGIQYFPNFEEKHYYIKHLFDYYVDIFYHKFFTSLESIFHIINAFYKMELKPNIGFQGKVLKILNGRNKPLHELIIDFMQDGIFLKAQKLRNNLTHNFSPSDIDSGISEEKNDRIRKISWGVGKYTPSNEILTNIKAVLDLFSSTLRDMGKLLNSGGAEISHER